MSNVLFAWELGSGFGHVRPLLAVARALASHGHTPVFAVRNIADTWPAFREAGFTVLQAPFRYGAPRLAPGKFSSRSFADTLSISGFSDPDELEPLLRGWDVLLDRIRPALAVADHAPALTLAARGAFPVVQIGAGFSLPPSHLPEFPVLRPSVDHLVPPELLLASIREVQRRRGRPAPATLPALFDTGPSFPTGFPEFDPYSALRIQPSVGPLDPPPEPSPLPTPHAWFAYFAAEVEGIEEILADLARSGIPGRAYIRSLARPARARLRASGLDVADSPLPMPEILATASVIVHHAGTGLGAAALAAGRPQLVFPLWLEQEIPARRLQEIGVALAPGATLEPGVALKRLAGGDPSFAAAAARAAERTRAAGPWRGCEVVAKACLSLMSGETRA